MIERGPLRQLQFERAVSGVCGYRQKLIAAMNAAPSDHPEIPRAQEIIANLNADLSVCLEDWQPPTPSQH